MESLVELKEMLKHALKRQNFGCDQERAETATLLFKKSVEGLA